MTILGFCRWHPQCSGLLGVSEARTGSLVSKGRRRSLYPSTGDTAARSIREPTIPLPTARYGYLSRCAGGVSLLCVGVLLSTQIVGCRRTVQECPQTAIIVKESPGKVFLIRYGVSSGRASTPGGAAKSYGGFFARTEREDNLHAVLGDGVPQLNGRVLTGPKRVVP